ncbi:MAG: Lar family restriction alleviation protein [Proteobacteria bacterium]|nr:Lar family restriction alleviation protein [Pseudomonadota bacterium]
MTDELKLCPFCGGEPTEHAIEPHSHAMTFGDFKMPDHEGSHVIECVCGAGLIDDTRKAVVARWNTRALTQRPAAQEVEALERCAQWCDEQASSDWHGRKASDMVRAFASLPAPQQATPEPAGEVVGYRVSVPGEPELGHWFSEDPLLEGYKVEPLCIATKPEPMTDEQAYDLFGVHYQMGIIRAVEAHHGITAQAKGVQK